MTINILPIELIDQWSQSQGDVHLPTPILTTQTDGDGRFDFSVIGKDRYFILAMFVRYGEERYQTFQWRQPMSNFSDITKVFLNESNDVVDGSRNRRVIFDQ